MNIFDSKTCERVKVWRHSPHAWLLLGVVGFWTGLYSWLIGTQFVFSRYGLETRLVTTWGDWAAHLIMTTRMAFGESLIPNQNPFLLGTDFVYPFGINLISGALIRLGVPVIAAFITPHVLSVVGSILLISAVYHHLTKSNLTTALALTILMTSGGFSYLHESELGMPTTPSTPREQQLLTFRQNTDLVWGALAVTLLIPQRALPLGILMGMAILALCYQVAFTKIAKDQKQRKAWAAGALLALLPFAHTHSFLAVGILLTCWGIGLFFVAKRTELIALLQSGWPLILMGVSTVVWQLIRLNDGTSDTMIRWQPGWYVDSLNEWFIFWWNNWGIVPLAALAGWHLLKKSSNNLQTRAKLLIPASFFILFALLNLIIFQPHIWDNTKLLFWVAIGFSGLAAYGFHSMYASAQQLTKPLLRHAAQVGLAAAFLLTIYGGLHDSLLPLSRNTRTHLLFSSEELELAEWVKKSTDPGSIWLTDNNHNHWLTNLTGRQALMSYPGWLWTHGLDYHQQELAMQQLFADPTRTDSIEKWGIEYAVLGKNQQTTAAESAFARHHQLVHQSESYKIFRLNK